MSAFDRLIAQIDSFIRKYYKNEMLKGGVIFILFLLGSWLVVSGLEFFGRFGSSVRLALLLLFVAGNVFILVRYLVRPLFSLYSFGKRINREQAARIIGGFFPGVGDRLLNTLQLQSSVNPEDRSFELLRASVAQRSGELSVLPFSTAVQYKESRRYLKFLIPLLLVICALAIFIPAWIVDASSSVVNYEVAQPAPFGFSLQSSPSAIDEGESYKVVAAISGRYFPEKVYLVSRSGRYLMTKDRRNQVSFNIENVKSDLDFHFEAEDVQSREFHIAVIGKSALGNVVAAVHYPSYLGMKDQVLSNIADASIPEGSIINWKVEARNTKSVIVLSGENKKVFNDPSFSFSETYRDSRNIGFVTVNSFTEHRDTSRVQLNIIRDAFPAITVSESIDSLRNSIRSFEGFVSDDHGLTSLKFHYVITGENGKEVKRSLPVDKVSGTSHHFVFSVDFGRENLAVEDKISYYFSVSDNDAVNGHKTSRSQFFSFQLPSLEQLNENRDETQKDVQKSLEDMTRKVGEFRKDVNKLQKSLSNQGKADFKSMEMLKDLQQQQQQLQQEMQAVQQELSESNEEKNRLSEQDEELLKQQEMIDELMKQVMDDEMKKLLEDLEKLLMENNRQQIEQQSENLEQSSEEMKKQLDRTLESLKRLQVNEKIDDLEKELNELAKEQEDLKQQEENKSMSPEDAKEKQSDLDKKFDEIQEDIKELNELNKNLERPMEIGDFQKEQQDIENSMQQAGDQLSKGNKSKAGQNQSKAAQQMKELADQLNNAQQESNQKQNEEDMSLLRLLLENLMRLSFDEESNLQSFVKVKDTDPVYRTLGRKQRSIIDDSRLVEDSLTELAKRQPKVSTFIDKELKDIRMNFSLITNEIDDHQRRSLNQHQQLVMTSYNNLALLLNESLQSMQQQQQQQKNQKPGSGSCQNPGGSGQPKSGSGQMSGEDMKQMLKKQLESMKKGPNPGGKQPGDKPGQGNTGMGGLGNKQIAKMAAEQTAIRQRLEQLRNELNKEGQGKGNQLNPLIQELEKQERDLINKQFSQEMVKRQQDILTRLLESEKAIRERGFEEKRESQSGKDFKNGNLIRFDEYNRQRLGRTELLRSIDPELAPYYQGKAGEYLERSR